MEFGIGLVVGGMITGFAAAKSGTALKTLHLWLSKAEAAVDQKIAAKANALKSKL